MEESMLSTTSRSSWALGLGNLQSSMPLNTLAISGQAHSPFQQPSSRTHINISANGVSRLRFLHFIGISVLHSAVWLAPASAWSLTARLIVMLTEKLDVNSVHSPPRFYLDGDIYPFAWSTVTTSESPETSDLPAVDYALHLFQIVRFRLGQMYRFFDDSFATRIQEFYNIRLTDTATEPRFWFVQFLLVLALGNALFLRLRNQTAPPGSKYFARAMAAMPNHTSTGKDSILAIEALALAGLYLYSIDHREAAHVQVSG